MLDVVNKVNKNGKMDVTDVEDMNRSDKLAQKFKDDPKKTSMDLTEESIKIFKDYLDQGAEWYTSRNLKPDYYTILKYSILKTFKWDILFCIVFSILSEATGVFYSYFIGEIIRYLKDPEETSKTKGAIMVVIFITV